MNPETEALSELQEVEIEILQKRDELERLKPRAVSVQKRLKDGTERVTREKAELLQLRKNIDLTRLETARLEAAIKHFEGQQGLIRTAKEMAALSHEMDSSREKKKALDAEITKMEQRRDDLDKSIADLEGSADAIRRNCEEEIADIKAEAEQLKTALKDLKVRQTAARAKISEEILEEYDDLNRKYPGSAMVDAREGGCLGCNMELIPQLKIELKMGKELLRCHRCGRILRRDLDFTPKPDSESSAQ